jgi:hypothetical protein
MLHLLLLLFPFVSEFGHAFAVFCTYFGFSITKYSRPPVDFG